MLTKNRKRRLTITLIALSIALGTSFYFFINLFWIYDVSHYRTVNDFTIDYSEGYGGVQVAFRISYRNYAYFNSLLIFETISSQDVEEIGITRVSYDIFRDNQFLRDNILDFPEPIMEGIDSFIISGIGLHDNISCIGYIDAQFNVSGIVQYERIDFILSIIMPVNPLEIRQVHLMNLIWAEYGLGILIVVLLIFFFRIIQIWRREATYTPEEKKKDREFFEYIGDKLEEFKKE